MPQFALTPRNIQIRDNFDAIAPKYDLTNRVLSLGIDLHWRRVAVRLLRGMPDDGTVLDLACGTCDLALEVLRQRGKARVVGADLSRVMLRLAQKKVAQRFAGRSRAAANGAGPISLVNAPAEALPFADGIFDGAMIGFGIRNVPEFRAGLREMRRVLRPGGRAVILEFSTPPNPVFRAVSDVYLHRLVPRIGALLGGDAEAYRYLPRSIARFPGAEGLAERLRAAGFSRVRFERLAFGVVAVHVADA